VDPVSGKLFVADSANLRILRFSSTAAYQSGTEAEAVLGQENFTSASANRGQVTPSANTLNYPSNITFDSSGRLWVADYYNGRVLRFDNAAGKSDGADADGVLGQPNFETAVLAEASGMHSDFRGPSGVTVDSSGNLWVSDFLLSRILRFSDTATKMGNVAASSVLGQPDLGTFATGTSATTLDSPAGISLGSEGELWVTDVTNHRVLRFDGAASKGNGAAADGVLGQTDFDTGTNGLSAGKFNGTYNAVIAPNGTLWVSEINNLRVLGFRAARSKSNGANADLILGQPTFTAVTNVSANSRSVGFPSQIAIGREGSLLVADFSGRARVTRFSDKVTVKPTKKTIKTSRKRVTFRGRSTGATKVQYRIAGQGGFKTARGPVYRWKGKTKKLSKRSTRITLRATAFDGARATGKMKIVSKR